MKLERVFVLGEMAQTAKENGSLGVLAPHPSKVW